jgi:putative transposase
VFSLKIRLSPTKAQKSSIKKQLELHRLLYNSLLEKRVKLYKEEKKSISAFDLIKQELPAHKNDGCNYSSMQQTVRRLDKAYQFFFKKHNSFPRFKKSFRSIEFGKYGDGWKLKDKGLYIQHVGIIKLRAHQEIKEQKHLTLLFDGLDFWAIIACNFVKDEKPCPENMVGIDMGMITFATLSNGKKIEHPLPYLKKLKKLQKEQSRFSRTDKKARKEKLRKRLKKIYKKINNQRADFAHKTSRAIVNNYSHIFVEDLNIKAMDGFSNFNRKKADLAWGIFLQMLQYKAESAGRVFVKVNPAYTSQTCIKCGNIKKLELDDREYICPVCGHIEDRDIMAAKNILAVGLYSLDAAKAAS